MTDSALQVAPLPARAEGEKSVTPLGAELRLHHDRARNCACSLSVHLAIYARTIVTLNARSGETWITQ